MFSQSCLCLVVACCNTRKGVLGSLQSSCTTRGGLLLLLMWCTDTAHCKAPLSLFTFTGDTRRLGSSFTMCCCHAQRMIQHHMKSTHAVACACCLPWTLASLLHAAKQQNIAQRLLAPESKARHGSSKSVSVRKTSKVHELALHSGAAKLCPWFVASAVCTQYARVQEPNIYDLCLSRQQPEPLLLGEGKRLDSVMHNLWSRHLTIP